MTNASTKPVLAIETSQRAGGVALRDMDGNTHHEALAETKRHDDDLMPAIARVFERAGLAPNELGAVGVSIGPGGFTGLRIAVSTVKMLAAVHATVIAAIPSGLVAAESCSKDALGDGPILVTLAAKRESFWAARLECDGGHWRFACQEDERGALLDADSMSLEGITALLGDRFLPDAARERCAAAEVPVVEPLFDARACLAVTRRRLEEGRTIDAHTLAPLYPRLPEAVRLWNDRLRDRGEL